MYGYDKKNIQVWKVYRDRGIPWRKVWSSGKETGEKEKAYTGADGKSQSDEPGEEDQVADAGVFQREWLFYYADLPEGGTPSGYEAGEGGLQEVHPEDERLVSEEGVWDLLDQEYRTRNKGRVACAPGDQPDWGYGHPADKSLAPWEGDQRADVWEGRLRRPGSLHNEDRENGGVWGTGEKRKEDQGSQSFRVKEHAPAETEDT